MKNDSNINPHLYLRSDPQDSATSSKISKLVYFGRSRLRIRTKNASPKKSFASNFSLRSRTKFRLVISESNSCKRRWLALIDSSARVICRLSEGGEKAL